MIYGWIHVGKVGGWEEILQDQQAALKDSGLLDATTEVFYGYGEGETLPLGENPTLLSMWEWARENPGHKVWYIHTKGASHKGGECEIPVHHWRKYMEHFVIWRWRDCVEALDDHDACGVEWITPFMEWVKDVYSYRAPFPAFGGNFWWANSDHIARICPEGIKDEGNRHAAEYKFVGQKWPKVKCFHTSYKHLYFEEYLPENYIGLDEPSKSS